MGTQGPRDYRELLRAGRWFASLPADLQERLVEGAALRTLTARQRLFSRGDEADGLYAVLDGGIRVSGSSPSGREALLTLLEPPSWFGEISVFDGQPRTHDAVAESEALVLHVSRPALDAILEAQPRYWRDLGLLVTTKLRLAFSAMEDMALLPISVRLARRLALMVEGYGEREHQRRTVEVSQEQLAQMLSTSRQTANHLLKELEGRGLIRLSYGTIEILDLEGLRRAAQPTD
ncbi:MAG: Crp/Fnr family transcriptional regulator [Myxococcales bacterium]|nr:Crp/Fnr family transcriptional regulator [Myxococcales bacterium]